MAPSQPSGWPQELVDNSNINQSDDGLSIKCTLCETTRGREVLLTMRRAFSMYRWHEHKKTAFHIKALQESLLLKPKVQSSIESMFSPGGTKRKAPQVALSNDEIVRRTTPSVLGPRACMGIFNHPQKKVEEIKIYEEYAAVQSECKYLLKNTARGLTVFSKECINDEYRCVKCKDINSDSVWKLLKNKYLMYHGVLIILRKKELAESDFTHLSKFANTKKAFLNDSGILLLKRVKIQMEYHKECILIAKKMNMDSELVQGVDPFIASFMQAFKNPIFKDSLTVGLVRAAVAKFEGQKNPQYAAKVLGWFSMLESSSRKTFEVASANLIGPSLRHMQKLNAKNRIECILDTSEDRIMKRLISIRQSLLIICCNLFSIIF